MKATEKLTTDQVRTLIEQKVNKAIEDRGADDFSTKLAIRQGVIEAFLDILITNDPTDIATKLHLAETKYLINRFENTNDKEGYLLKSFYTEDACDYALKHYQFNDPESIYTKSIKIITK